MNGAPTEMQSNDASKTDREVRTAFDVFGSELPDEFFADVFDQPRQRDWREVEL